MESVFKTHAHQAMIVNDPNRCSMCGRYIDDLIHNAPEGTKIYENQVRPVFD